MLRLAVTIALFLSTRTEDLLGVSYSFDVDFYRNFESKECDGSNTWRLVDYEALDVEPPNGESGRGIQAVGDSCVSSFPIIFVHGVLELDVYAQVISTSDVASLKLSVELFDENDVCVISYVYRHSSKEFTSGWRTISLNIDEHFKGYIRLRGSCLSNETLLIDSFRYIPDNDHRRKKRSLTDERDDDAEIIFKYKSSNNPNSYDTIESSGDGEYVTDEPTMEEPPERFIWNPFTIAMVSIGGGVVFVIIVVSAFHCGKIRATRNDPLQIEDIEPPRTLTIPRVVSVSNRRPSRFYEF